MLDVALKFHADKIAVIPLIEKKAFLQWVDWQKEPQTTEDVQTLFRNMDNVNIAGIHGIASSNTFGVDCDNPQSFSSFGSYLERIGITTLVVRSNTITGKHAGGGTYILRTNFPVETMTVNGWNFRGQGAYSVLAGIHETGSAYTTTNEPIFQLEGTLPGIQLVHADTTKREKRIPRLAWRLLNCDRRTIAQYETRSEAEMAICCSLLRAGYDKDTIISLFKVYSGPGKFGELLAESSRTAFGYLNRTIEKAKTFVENNDGDNEDVELAKQAKQWAMSTPWHGRTGATDKAVFIAHCDIVLKCKRMPYGASCRELAELAGVNAMTATNATHRLINKNLIMLDTQNTVTLSSRYKLVRLLYTLSCTHVMECIPSVQNNDVFRFFGLGKTGLDIWEVLLSCPEGAKTSFIIERTGRARVTVYSKLKQMFSLGMVEPMGDSIWKAVDDIDFDGIAEELGTLGTLDEQKKRHFLERRRNKANVALGKMREH